MTNHESFRLNRRTLLTGAAVLGASAATACTSRPLQGGQQTPTAAVEQNTAKRRGVGLRAFNPERAAPGFTLFAPLIWGDGGVYLIDLPGDIVHTWNMPYPPGLSGYLTERGTLFYNGRTSEDSFLSRFPFKGGVVLEADWNGKVLWEVRHPAAQWQRVTELHGPGSRRHRPACQRRGGGGPFPLGPVCAPVAG